MKKIWTLLSLFGALSLAGCAEPETVSPDADDADLDTPVTVDDEGLEPAGEAARQSAGSVHYVKADPKWATLRAKFVYGGEPPEPKKVDASKDEFCAKLDIFSDALIVNEDGGIKNIALFMDARRSKANDVHPDLQKPEAKTIELDNDGCMFEPHVLFARPGYTIEVLNSDKTGHNANFNFFNNAPVNFLVPVGGQKELTLTADEPAPIPVECNVHPWMKAFVIVQEHPYVGISDKDGVLEIENLPVGEVTFRVWHESADGSIDEAEVDGKKERWSRGRMEVQLKPGVNDLGTIVIDASKFKQ